jgi:hypothetical protein
VGDLERQRDARDMWISRGHLVAMAAGTLVLAGTTFALGFTVGRSTAPPAALAAADGDRDLVDLLARVESSSRPHGGVDALTFPDALEGSPTGPAPMPDAAIGSLPTDVAPTDAALQTPLPVGAPVVLAPNGVAEPVGDAPHPGAYTIEVSRFDEAAGAEALKRRLMGTGLDAWISLNTSDGRGTWRVDVAAYPDEPSAGGALADVTARVKALGVPAAPTVVPNGH